MIWKKFLPFLPVLLLAGCTTTFTQVTPLLDRIPYGITNCPSCPAYYGIATIYDLLIGTGAAATEFYDAFIELFPPHLRQRTVEALSQTVNERLLNYTSTEVGVTHLPRVDGVSTGARPSAPRDRAPR